MTRSNKSIRHQRGAVAIIVALSIFVLVGMIGLAIDLGRMFVIKTELQNAADACALGAARELDGTANALTRADNVGVLIGIRNKINFQHEPTPVTAASLTYSENLGPNSNYKSSDAIAPEDIANMKYAMCAVAKPNIGMLFMGANSFGPQTVRAYAVATLAPGQTNCAVPLGVCKNPAGNANSTPKWGLIVGQWYGGKFSSTQNTCQDGTTSGNFNWIDFSPPNGGADELKDMIEGSGQCELPPVGTLVGQTGMNNGLRAAWNSRFGIYGLGLNLGDVNTFSPDQTGVAYTGDPAVFPSGQNYATWPAGQNAYNGSDGDPNISTPNYLTAAGAWTSYQSDNPANANGTALASVGTPSHQTNGRSRRLVVTPIVDCVDLCVAPTQTVPVLDYACVLMLSPLPNNPNSVWVEYRGLASDPDSPCATFGLAGGTVGPLVPVLVQ